MGAGWGLEEEGFIRRADNQPGYSFNGKRLDAIALLIALYLMYSCRNHQGWRSFDIFGRNESFPQPLMTVMMSQRDLCLSLSIDKQGREGASYVFVSGKSCPINDKMKQR